MNNITFLLKEIMTHLFKIVHIRYIYNRVISFNQIFIKSFNRRNLRTSQKEHVNILKHQNYLSNFQTIFLVLYLYFIVIK